MHLQQPILLKQPISAGPAFVSQAACGYGLIPLSSRCPPSHNCQKKLWQWGGFHSSLEVVVLPLRCLVPPGQFYALLLLYILDSMQMYLQGVRFFVDLLDVASVSQGPMLSGYLRLEYLVVNINSWPASTVLELFVSGIHKNTIRGQTCRLDLQKKKKVLYYCLWIKLFLNDTWRTRVSFWCTLAKSMQIHKVSFWLKAGVEELTFLLFLIGYFLSFTVKNMEQIMHLHIHKYTYRIQTLTHTRINGTYYDKNNLFA